MGGGGWGEGHPNKRKDNGICPWMDIGWKNQGSYSFFLLQSKKPHSVIPPPRFFFLHKALQLEEGAGGGQVVRRKDGKGEGCSGLK